MEQQVYKTEGVNRTQTMRFHPFVFTGKERDEETGYGYFCARYMDHELTTMWLSVDPMSDKYPSLSPYNYCAWNPVKLVDPNGEEFVISTSKDENGNKIVNIKFTAVLVDKTRTSILTDDGLSEEQMNNYKDQITKAITQTWNTTTDDGTITRPTNTLCSAKPRNVARVYSRVRKVCLSTGITGMNTRTRTIPKTRSAVSSTKH